MKYFKFVLIATFIPFIVSCSSGVTLYVSKDGDDQSPGSKSQPIATLEEAVERIKKENSKAVSEIVIMEGTYYLSESLVFDNSIQALKKGNSLLITNEDNQEVTISGAKKLEAEWSVYRDGIYKCNLDKYEGLDFGQLFINGQRQVRARFPNGDSKFPDKDAFIYPVKADEWPHSKIFYDPATFSQKTWERPGEAIIHIFPSHHWGNLQYRISDVNYDEKYIGIIQRDPQINETYFKMMSEPGTWIGKNSNFFIDNVFEELDTEGEWYFDNESNVLYYYPHAGMDIESALIEVPLHKEIVHIQGTMESPVRNIEFRNIRFAGTKVTYMDRYEYPSMGDWGIVRSGAVFIEGAENITIGGCFFDAVGGNAVFINKYAQGINVTNNIFSESGESAVCLVGESHLNFKKSYECEFCGADHPWGWDKPSEEIPSECDISNNIIHDIGVFGKQVAGVFMAISKKNTISHNHIYNTPRAGICFNDGWHGGHLVEYNDIHHTVRETGDHGPFNSWGRETFWCRRQSHGNGASHPAGNVLDDAKYTTVIRNNRFTDPSGWGIDLDDGSSNYHVYNNLCIGVSVKLREGVGRLVENNIFYKGANPPSIHRGYENNQDIFRRNIVVVDSVYYNPTPDINFVSSSRREYVFHFITPPARGKYIEVLDSNLYHTASGNFTARVNTGGRDLGLDKIYIGWEDWKELGFDQNSLLADPLFADAKNADFKLSANSPAFDIGFEEFNLDKFGLSKDFSNLYLHEPLNFEK